jgi:hypothetical protein
MNTQRPSSNGSQVTVCACPWQTNDAVQPLRVPSS